ncbi:hypothetical protein EDD21DRAFT_391054, partial [Dissophora ornata]
MFLSQQIRASPLCLVLNPLALILFLLIPPSSSPFASNVHSHSVCSTMAKSTPLDLPEIQLAVASHLTDPSLVQCLRVCKSWYRTLLPLVWRQVQVGYSMVKSRQQGPSPRNLKQHCELVCGLVIEGSNSWDVTHYPNLHTLTLDVYSKADTGLAFEDTLAALIALNKSIVVLKLRMKSIPGLAFWRAASELDQLRSLHLSFFNNGMGVGADAVEYFLKVCMRLQYLEVLGPKLVGCSHFTNLSFPRMRTLLLLSVNDVTPIDQLEFISRCPGLERLAWHVSSVVKQLAGKLASGMWPDLEAFELIDLYSDVADEDIALIINGMRRATGLDFGRSPFGPSAFQALRRHFSTLKHLRLTNCIAMTSSMLQEILGSCPQLVELKVDKVLAKDIVDGEPWACLSIKSLQIQIGFGQGEQHLQPLVFKQLSRLVQLQRLYIGGYSSGGGGGGGG